MLLSENSRRRLFIKLGLLSVAGIFVPPVYRYAQDRRIAEEWNSKWHLLPNNHVQYNTIPTLRNASQVPKIIDHDLTLLSTNSPWVIDSEVIINKGVTLTIEAGCEIFIGRENYITVNGCIVAIGKAEKPIRFSAYSNADIDKWAGLFFLHPDKSSVFQYTEFENSFYGARCVRADTSWISCTYKNVQSAYSDYKSNALMKNCLIDNKNHPETGNINSLKFHKGSVHMEGCTVNCPDSNSKVDAIDADHLLQGVFRGNRLNGGLGPGADGLDIGRESRNIVIENNIISNFVDKGISIGENADAIINNNVIVWCAIGLGVKDSAHAKVSNTTFYGNDYAVKSYEKVLGRGGGHVELTSCIIANSKKAAFGVDSKSTLSFTETLCDQQLLPGKGNQHGKPEFDDIERNQFDCNNITLADNTSMSCTHLGAHIPS